METKSNRPVYLPYLYAVLLVIISLLLDSAIPRSREITAKTFNPWPVALLSLGARWIFALLTVLLIWSLARTGLSRAGAWILTACGLLLSAAPLAWFAGWMYIRILDKFLMGSYSQLSAAVLLVGGAAVLISAGRKKISPASAAGCTQDSL